MGSPKKSGNLGYPRDGADPPPPGRPYRPLLEGFFVHNYAESPGVSLSSAGGRVSTKLSHTGYEGKFLLWGRFWAPPRGKTGFFRGAGHSLFAGGRGTFRPPNGALGPPVPGRRGIAKFAYDLPGRCWFL